MSPAGTSGSGAASAPRSSPVASTRPAYRPAPAAPRPVERPDDEPETLNPFTLWRRAFRFGGRFNRGEFAMSYFGAIVFFYGIIFVSPP